MNRIKLLQDALEINQVQATITSKLIEDLPDDKLTDFVIFRMDFVQPMKSKELITKEAVFEFKKIIYINQIKNGKYAFNAVEEVKSFCQKYFKEKEICNGPDGYFDYVIIAMDKDGNLINKFATNEFGNYLKLESDKAERVYQWLFENPERIGIVDVIPYYETPNLIKLESYGDFEYKDTSVIEKLENFSKKVSA
jgi:hypothetical protein